MLEASKEVNYFCFKGIPHDEAESMRRALKKRAIRYSAEYPQGEVMAVFDWSDCNEEHGAGECRRMVNGEYIDSDDCDDVKFGL